MTEKQKADSSIDSAGDSTDRCCDDQAESAHATEDVSSLAGI